jgi:cytidylate kinase
MSDTIFLEKCQTYIDCHMQRPRSEAGQSLQPAPSITISRQTGAGGLTVAKSLADWLNHRVPGAGVNWTVFHKNLVSKVLEDSKLPARLAQFMPEDKVSGISDAVEEILGLHPASWKLIRRTTETILQLAELGHAIIVGRGANVVAQRLTNTFHVRLVGGLNRRAERIMAQRKINKAAALGSIKKSDAGRKRYVKKYYGANIDDPLMYHLIINTDDLAEPDVSALIGQVVVRKFYPD